MTTPDKPRRHWLRFSLRSLFLLVLVIAVSLGWMIHKAREQVIAVAALKEMGCGVDYDDIYPPDSPTVLERLRSLLGEDELSVTVVNGEGSQITDSGLVHLVGMTQLQQLLLSDTQVTDAGVVHLQGLTQLDYLDLDRTEITDAGLGHLRGLTQLRELTLEGTQVTDAGLANLEALTQLRMLYLNRTKVSDAGIQRLRKALPHCQINWQP